MYTMHLCAHLCMFCGKLQSHIAFWYASRQFAIATNRISHWNRVPVQFIYVHSALQLSIICLCEINESTHKIIVFGLQSSVTVTISCIKCDQVATLVISCNICFCPFPTYYSFDAIHYTSQHWVLYLWR